MTEGVHILIVEPFFAALEYSFFLGRKYRPFEPSFI